MSVVHLSVGRNVSLMCESGSPVSVLAECVISVCRAPVCWKKCVISV